MEQSAAWSSALRSTPPGYSLDLETGSFAVFSDDHAEHVLSDPSQSAGHRAHGSAIDCSSTMSFDPSDVVPSQSIPSLSQMSEAEPLLVHHQLLSSPGLDVDTDPWNITCPIVMMQLADRTEIPRISESDEWNDLINWRPSVPGVPMDDYVDGVATGMHEGNATTTLAFSHDGGRDDLVSMKPKWVREM